MGTPWPAACEEHRSAIMGFLIRRLRRPDEAEDLCQEVFARVLRADPQLRDTSRARAYLFSAARHVLLNHARHQRPLVLESDLPPGHGIAESRTVESSGPEEALRLRRLAARLEELLAALPSDLRRAFELGVIERQRYAEIARMTGWSLAKVKVSVYRARKHLILGLRAQDRCGSESEDRHTEEDLHDEL
ncbi:MAG: RNA polymerase sigma factor [Candidatus Eisenbacteria bacterium]